MTDQPLKVYVVQHVDGVARPFEPGDAVHVMEGVLVDQTITVPGTPNPDLDERRAVAARDFPAAIRRLDALTDRVSRAVLDLHRRRPGFIYAFDCEHCLEASDMGDHLGWPCDTVEAVATVHGIDLTDAWLFDRPDDGSLDQPEARP